MTGGSPAETFRGFIEDVWNARDLEAFARYVSPRVRFHPPRGRSRSYDEYRAMAEDFLRAFPDLRFTVAKLAADGPLVAAHLLIEGTHDGPFRGRSATGRRVRVEGRPWCRVEEGRIVEFWQMFDELGMLHQLGLLTDASLLGHAPFDA